MEGKFFLEMKVVDIRKQVWEECEVVGYTWLLWQEGRRRLCLMHRPEYPVNTSENVNEEGGLVNCTCGREH